MSARIKKFGKLALYVVIGAAFMRLMVGFLISNDPHKSKAELFVKSSTEVKSQLGPVQSLELYRVIAVNDAISTQDEFVPGFQEYHFHAMGERGRAKIVLRTVKGEKHDDVAFKIESLER